MALYPYFLQFPVSSDYIITSVKRKWNPFVVRSPWPFGCRVLELVVEPCSPFGLPWLRIAHFSVKRHSPPFYRTADSYSAPSSLSPGRVGSGLTFKNCETFLFCSSIIESIILSPFVIFSSFRQGRRFFQLKHVC